MREREKEMASMVIMQSASDDDVERARLAKKLLLNNEKAPWAGTGDPCYKTFGLRTHGALYLKSSLIVMPNRLIQL